MFTPRPVVVKKLMGQLAFSVTEMEMDTCALRMGEMRKLYLMNGCQELSCICLTSPMLRSINKSS